jgi:hypothetical protein
MQRQFRFDPTEVPSEAQIYVDYILLTADNESDTYFDIKWNCTDPDSSDLQVSLYYDNDNQGYNGSQIAELSVSPSLNVFVDVDGPSQNAPSFTEAAYSVFLPLIESGYSTPCTGQCYTWITSAIPEGTYYIYAQIKDGHNTTKLYSETPLIITHSP